MPLKRIPCVSMYNNTSITEEGVKTTWLGELQHTNGFKKKNHFQIKPIFLDGINGHGMT